MSTENNTIIIENHLENCPNCKHTTSEILDVEGIDLQEEQDLADIERHEAMQEALDNGAEPRNIN